MRAFLLIGWLMVPVVVAAYHYGPGQDRLRLDDAAQLVRQAEGHVANQEWSAAVDSYEAAMRLVPGDRKHEMQRLRLERAKAQMLAKKLPEAHQDLQALVEEVNGNGDARLETEARSALASAQYYMTWLMRLEGLPREDWEPEIEAARQTYRLLAEQAEKTDPAAARKHQADLEAAIRLARMELGELQGLPLPSQ